MSQKNILDLNQDCLNYLFSSYFDIYQLIDIEDTCSLFNATCLNVYTSKKFHKLKLELRTMRVDYLNHLIERIWPTAREFSFSGGFIMDEKVLNGIIYGLADHSRNLKKLTINYVTMNENLLTKLQNGLFEQLNYLNLSNCTINEQNLGVVLKNENLKNLKQLVLSGNVNMIGNFFQNLENIEELDISFCSSVTYFHLLIFFKTCKNLKHLNISSSPQAIPEGRNIFEDLLKYQPNIEVLLMANNGIEADNEILAKFKYLKQTSFSGRRWGL